MEEFYLNQPSNHECFKLPERDKKYLLRNNFLNEYFSDEDKAQVRSNLGITSLLDELKGLILAKLFDEEGNVTFDLEPHEDAYNKVLSSSVIYRILLKYYTKEELDEWRESVIDGINAKIQELEDIVHVDNELKNDSEHPVLNKVIYGIIDLINTAYSRLSNNKVNREELLNYYTIEAIENILSTYYTKELIDNDDYLLINRINEIGLNLDQTNSNLESAVININNQLTQEVNTLNTKIDLLDSLLETSIFNLDSKIDLLISGVNLSITNLDNELSLEISNTNSLIELLGLSVAQISESGVTIGDNKTIKKEGKVLSTLLTIHKLSQQEINDESIDSAYELQNSSGERIGDKITINKSTDYSLIIEQLQLLILLLQESQLKYIIIDESAYEQLTSYVQGAIYLVLEDGESVNNTGWRLGDGLPIILSGEWLFGDNLPIILS